MYNEKESIRASRLSNREVMLSSTAALHNMNLPSSSTSASVDYLIRSRMPCSSFKSGQSTSTQSSEPAKPLTSSCMGSKDTDADDEDDIEAETNSNNNIENSDQDTATDLSLSQYELDIVNKYLNEINNDDGNDDEKICSDSEQLNSSSMADNVDDGHNDNSIDVNSNAQPIDSDQMNACDPCSTAADVSIESDGGSPMQSQSHDDASTSTQQQQQQPQQLFPVSSANEEIRACTQTSRQIVFDQTSHQIDAMINPIRNTDYLGHTHNDVNNNNLSLSSNNNNHNQNNNQTDSHRTLNQGMHYSSERRHYGMTGRTNPISNRLTITNIPIIVGLTSCVWGLFFYAVKCFFFSDLT